MPLGIAKARRGTPALEAEHRARLKAVVDAAIARYGKHTPNQDFRSATTYAGVPFTFDAYMDRVDGGVKTIAA